MTYRELQKALKQFRTEGKIPATFKLNQKKAVLQAMYDEVVVEQPAKSDLDILLLDIVYKRGVGDDEIFESPQALAGEPETEGCDDWSFFQSTLTRRYQRLSAIYHPDHGGTEEQMRNLTHAFNSAQLYVKANNGMDL